MRKHVPCNVRVGKSLHSNVDGCRSLKILIISQSSGGCKNKNQAKPNQNTKPNTNGFGGLILMETFVLAILVFQVCLSLSYISVVPQIWLFYGQEGNGLFSLYGRQKGGVERRSLSHFSKAEVAIRWEHPWQRFRTCIWKNSSPSAMTNPHFYWI